MSIDLLTKSQLHAYEKMTDNDWHSPKQLGTNLQTMGRLYELGLVERQKRPLVRMSSFPQNRWEYRRK